MLKYLCAFALLIIPCGLLGQSYPPAGGGGGSGLPTATASGQIPISSGAGTTYMAGNLPGTQVSSAAASLAAQLPKFRIAIAKTRDGLSDTKILFVGDSTTWGQQSGNSSCYPCGAPVARTKISGVPVAQGLATPIQGLSLVSDGRMNFGSGWQGCGAGYGFGNYSCLFASSAGGNFVFTPNAAAGTYDSFDIYYLTDPSLGSFTATATGGTPVVVHQNVATGIGKVTVTAASASTSNTLTFSSSSGLNFITGFEPFLSTAKTVRLGNGGQGSTSTTNWVTAGPWGSVPTIKAYAPDLTIISLGINDAGASVATATVSANLQTIITAAQVSGDVILMTMPPSQNAPYTTFEAAYQPIFYGLATTNGVPLIDWYARFGGVWNTSYMFDAFHPNEYGYWDAGAMITRFLNSITGI